MDEFIQKNELLRALFLPELEHVAMANVNKGSAIIFTIEELENSMHHAELPCLNELEYLDYERTAPIKHEYVMGEVFAMAGASKVHGTLAGNAFIALRQHLRSKPCSVWMADMKVRVRADSAYYYPDVVVTCNLEDLGPEATTDFVEAPELIIEVLSDDTAPVDRRQKRLSYRRLPSLQEYVLIDQNKRWVEVYRRSETVWMQIVYEGEDAVELVSAALNLTLAELYSDTGL